MYLPLVAVTVTYLTCYIPPAVVEVQIEPGQVPHHLPAVLAGDLLVTSRVTLTPAARMD